MKTKNADLRGLDQMHREWEAWRQVCKHLERRGIDINAELGLAAALRLWGEENAELRRQGPEHLPQALAERRAEYAAHLIQDGKP